MTMNINIFLNISAGGLGVWQVWDNVGKQLSDATQHGNVPSAIAAAIQFTNSAIAAATPLLLSEMSAAAAAAPAAFSAATYENYLANSANLAGLGVLMAGLSATADLSSKISIYNNLADTASQAEIDAAALDVQKSFANYVFTGALIAILVSQGVPIGAIGLIVAFGTFAYDKALSFLAPYLNQINIDPLILDLDGDGIELISLANSNAHLDYGGDGFAERTGWVKGDDGILVFDRNANGSVDGIGEMFGSATQDGFEVLETLDTNADGKIDAADAEFANLRVWQDANEDGISDAGELKTLAELGIASISIDRVEVSGTNQGHDRGFAATSTRADGSTGAAETIYFQTDRADTIDPTPGFTPAEGVDKLPQLAGSGNIYSIAYTLTNDASFRADWTALADNAASMSEDAVPASANQRVPAMNAGMIDCWRRAA